MLTAILDTEISPELVPAKEGEKPQSTEAKIGPYELHDFFLYHMLRHGYRPSKIAYLAWHAWRDSEAGDWPAGFPEAERTAYDLATIRQWLEVFLHRYFASQFKRSAIPNGPKVVAGGALSPRGDWRMPSDATVGDVVERAGRERPPEVRRSEWLPLITVRDFDEADWPLVWPVIEQVVRAGDTFPFPTDLTEDGGARHLAPERFRGDVSPSRSTAICVLGTAKMGRNRPGPGVARRDSELHGVGPRPEVSAPGGRSSSTPSTGPASPAMPPCSSTPSSPPTRVRWRALREPRLHGRRHRAAGPRAPRPGSAWACG